LRVTYYRDGKTVYSRVSFEYGIKQGPCIKYYHNGQVFEHINFKDGERHGLCRKYHKNGQLLAEYENGIALPGLKEYSPEGALITENGAATQRFYLRPGETLEKEIKIIAEIPTDLGNILVKELSYHLKASNYI
jgi:antitoxin component YwqK of YwqJK toxin-antitoxin module